MIDVSVTGLDINQCEPPVTVANTPDNNINIGDEETDNSKTMLLGIKSFHNTHKCHNTSKVNNGYGLKINIAFSKSNYQKSFYFKNYQNLRPNDAQHNIGISLFNLADSHQ